jgi:hypothetical protein
MLNTYPINKDIKKYMLDSINKSMEKFTTKKIKVEEKDMLVGLQTYSNLLEKQPNILGLLLGILGFTITYRFIK